MAAKVTTKASIKPQAPTRRFPIAFTILLALAIPTAYLAVKQYGKWSVVSGRLNGVQGELYTMKSRNAVLAQAYDVLQNRRFQVCNKSPYNVRVDWISAAYHDGKNLKVFDSSRCSSWDMDVATGENANMFLSSSEEGCNWSGPVIYYAIRFVKETDEADVAYTMAGRYVGFDRDCFTIP